MQDPKVWVLIDLAPEQMEQEIPRGFDADAKKFPALKKIIRPYFKEDLRTYRLEDGTCIQG
jgi:hypothetical protein